MRQIFKSIWISYNVFLFCLSFVNYKNGHGQDKGSTLVQKPFFFNTTPLNIVSDFRRFTDNGEMSSMSLSIPATAFNQYQSIILC